MWAHEAAQPLPAGGPVGRTVDAVLVVQACCVCAHIAALGVAHEEKSVARGHKRAVARCVILPVGTPPQSTSPPAPAAGPLRELQGRLKKTNCSGGFGVADRCRPCLGGGCVLGFFHRRRPIISDRCRDFRRQWCTCIAGVCVLKAFRLCPHPPPHELLHISIRGVEPLLLLEARRWALTGREPPGAAAPKAATTTQHPIIPPYESAHRLSLTTAPPVAHRSGAAAARCRSL